LTLILESEEPTLSFYPLAIAALLTASSLAASTQATAETDESERPAIILDGGEGEAIAFPLHSTHRLAFASSNEAGMSFFEIRVPARSAAAPPHRHSHEDEFFYVRQGRVTFLADGKRKTIDAGGFVLLPRDGWHAVWNAGDEEATLLVGTSAGQFDDFFDAVAMDVANAGELPPPEMGEIVARLASERGVSIDMNRVPDDARALYGLPSVESD